MKVYSLLDSLGLSYIWSNQVHSIESFKRIVKQRLRDQFIQEWQSRLAENSVCCKYSCVFLNKQTNNNNNNNNKNNNNNIALRSI